MTGLARGACVRARGNGGTRRDARRPNARFLLWFRGRGCVVFFFVSCDVAEVVPLPGRESKLIELGPCDTWQPRDSAACAPLSRLTSLRALHSGHGETANVRACAAGKRAE